MISYSIYLAGAAVLYLTGIYALITKRNLIRLIMGIEMLVNAAHINFIALASYWRPGFVDPLATAIVTVSIGVAGCIGAVFLAFAIYAYKHYGTLDVRRMRELRG
ncbi:MAG: NADH-quinone oxidoreductase subunit K [Thaumarchaeota archaeon]|nr:NADH-quinone oxidoreductase subunit K [Nitrososphaerota archaeon]